MAKKKKIYKVGIDSETYAISLVEFPAIEETLVALEEQKQMKVQLADDEKYMIYSAVIVPDKPIYRRNDDGEEFYIEFTKESIEKMSQEFLQNYKQHEITLDHETMASDVTLVESWIKSDIYRDKSVALGLSEDLPVGTWIAGLKVNQIDVWDRIKKGELRGLSVESMISLEEFEKQEELNENNMNIETNEMFWDKLKNTLKDIFASVSMNEKEDIEPITIEDLSEQEPAPEPVAEPSEPVAEPVVDVAPEEPKEEPVEPQNEPQEEPKAEEPKDNHLEELINNLKAEIEALKEVNSGLQEKVKDLGKQPSAQPVNTNAKPSAGDTYSNWREQMRKMIG